VLAEIDMTAHSRGEYKGLVLKSTSNQAASAQTWLKVVTNLETIPE
jgi:hypothetical protein